MNKICILLSFFYTLTAFGQIDLSPDTILYAQKTGGTIDSFDISNADLPTTFDGGRSILSLYGLSTFSFYEDFTSRKYQKFSTFDPLQYSALPHLGFAYSFGGQGSQFVRLDYSQVYSEKLIFNLKYDRNSGNGFIQNASFTENNVRAQLQRNARRYSFQLKTSFQSFQMSHSGGVVDDPETDVIIDTFGLEFAPVNKVAASSTTKMGSIYLKNYFNFSPDSLNHFGVTTAHHYTITSREYLESDYLPGIYGTINIDSLTTRDQFNWARIRNAGGAYYLNKKTQFYLDALIEHGYWNFQNLSRNIDTNEISFVTNARIKIKDFVLNNTARLNLMGAFNEWSEEARFKYSNGKIKASGGFTLKNQAPEPFQRSYFANNFNYKLASIENQILMRTGGGLKWDVNDSVLNVGLSGDFTSLSSVYVFNDNVWSDTDNSSYTFASIQVNARVTIGKFGIQPKVIYTTATHNYLPAFQFYSRIFLKGHLFKAKKLEFVVGVDASYITKFNNRVYIPAVDAFNMNNAPGTSQTNAMFNLHAFASFGIEEFRFFVRYENIGYFWNSRTNEELSGYPISTTRMRIGLTWDFFN